MLEECNPAQKMIAIDALGFRFRGRAGHALSDVSLVVEAGEFVVVTGPSGCGKSTLALAMGGYLFQEGRSDGEASGSVWVAGIDVRRQPLYDVAEVVGLVQQNPEAQFCTLMVQDEVAFGLENRCLPKHTIEERIGWALGIVGASHLADRFLSSLSGGEKQKIAIAAVMAAKPKVLILDEPTSNLDPTATAEVFAVIDHIRAKAGITVVVIEHKLDWLLRFKPRLLVMDGGRLVHDRPASTSNGAYLHVERVRRQPPRPQAQDVSASPVVHVQDLEVGHDGQTVLKGVSVAIYPGEFVAVMGDNGSGKTTFLLSLLGLVKSSSGQVRISGKDTRESAVSELARSVGFVFQNPDHQLFAESVWQEATFATRNFGCLDDATEARARDLLARGGIGDRLDDHPYRLSYGEKRRLNLISILAHSPRLLLLDEILIGQDAANAEFLLDLLQGRTARGDTVIMVNHAPEVTRRYASRVLFFDSGQLIVDAATVEAFRRLARLGYDAYRPKVQEPPRAPSGAGGAFAAQRAFGVVL